VLREAWLGLMDEPTLNHQFVSGGVTFCTLMPMRAVPFRVVCLLGMNDGDFPRRAPKADFDLLAQPGMARPGDRSRRDDDRYLMLEALLAARDKLYISWVGRNVRDNSEQPASVLVSQLRDYLVNGWQLDLHARTTEHALQPFSRRYFEAGGLLTYAREWREAHRAGEDGEAPASSELPPFDIDDKFSLKLISLNNFVRQPVRFFFRQRLGVMFGESALVGEDEEPFSLNALERYLLEDTMLDDGADAEQIEEVYDKLTERAERLAREGVLPIGLIGQQYQRQLVEALVPVRCAWLTLREHYPKPAAKVALSLVLAGVRVDDWIDQLRSNGLETVWLTQMSSKVTDKQGKPRGDKLIAMWLRQLAAAAAGMPVTGYLVARDAIVTMKALPRDEALEALRELVCLWRDGMNRPLPTACKTALALAQGGDPRAVYDGGFEISGENEELCLARLWPDFAALSAQPDFADVSEALYGPLANWLEHHITIEAIEAGSQS
jgi:exodeoxyribonuclease V gamma subunit